MSELADRLVVSTFALWASDSSNFEQLAAAISSSAPDHDRTSAEEVASFDDIMRSVTALRLEQLRRRRQEAKKLLGGLEEAVLAASPVVLESSHLRGTLWRLDARQFVLQAYLTDLSWEAELFARARRLARLPVTDAGTDASRTPAKRFLPLGSSWIVSGNPFIRVELTDMGLIEALGVWTAELLEPDDGKTIVEAFQALLANLDEVAR